MSCLEVIWTHNEERYGMRIIQAQDKIPSQFKGKPVPEPIRKVISVTDSKHSLSYGEVEWILESLDDVLGFTTGHDIGPIKWDRTEAQLDMLMRWSRETGKSLLRTTLDVADSTAKAHFVNKDVVRVFEQKPYVIAYLKNKSDDVKKGFVAMESEVEGGLTTKEYDWLCRKITNSELFARDYMRKEYIKVIQWSRATGTELATINDYGTAKTLSQEWADYQRKVDLSKRLSKLGLRSVALSGKWRAIWVNPQAIAKPDPKVIDSQGDSDDKEFQVVAEITGLSMRNTDNVISICDPQGVPQAAIEVGEESEGRIEVHDVTGTTQGDAKIKELSAKLAQTGTKLWWAGESYEVGSIKDLEENVQDVHGFVPSLLISQRRSGRTTVGGDPDSYKEALDWTFSEAWGRSQYYSSQARDGIDAWTEYAEQRGELHLLEEARQEFEEWANDEWFNAEPEITRGNPDIPSRPDEDDEKFNVNGRFDRAAYERAEQEHYDAVAPYERNFEPNQFAQDAYEHIQARRDDPKNAPYYDIVESKRAAQLAERYRKQQEARDYERKRAEEVALAKSESERTDKEKALLKEMEAKRQREEAERQRQQAEADAATEAEMNRAFRDTSTRMVDNIQIPDDEDDGIFAFDITWKKTG